MTDADAKDAALARTPLHELHLELGARMVPFAGYQMPVQYPAGILKEHLHTRSQAGLFDVSHMGQVRIQGPRRAQALESLVTADIVGLAPGQQRYALFTDANGGILDDLMVVNAGEHLFLVVNAARKAHDFAHLQLHLGSECRIETLPGQALLALQGPAAAAVMERLAPAATALRFMQAGPVEIDGVGAFVSRSGYTGEDGFEISLPGDQAERVARRLLAEPEVAPVGLGARDSLRLEAGLCLYGHDMDTTTTPVEASLQWAIGKARRPQGERAGGFPGAERIFEHLQGGVARRRVGLLPQGRAPVREGAELQDGEGRNVGVVTSGGFGASLQAPVAMGYVDDALSRVGSDVFALVRGKPLAVKVAAMPFVKPRYFRG